ncbi:hypothetical protein L0Y59_01085 [Candidatus Uhrbacteria bacterium]|nr:hypothetical protein [Candidatus Uhrbacteria bacterium]
MTFPPLLQPSYWFTTVPPPLSPVADRVAFVLFAVFLVAGIVMRVVATRRGWEKMVRRLLIRSGGRLMTLGAFGLLLYALNYERVPVLSARFWFLLWAALLAWYAWKTYRYVRVEIPDVKRRREERERTEKWLPRPNP